MAKPERAGYVKAHKSFVERKPRTVYRITERGRNALIKYVRDLRAILGS